MLNIKDVVDLARAGYKPADVKELIELSKTPEPLQAETQPAPAAEPIISQSTPAETEPDKTPETVSKENTQPAVEPAYKALYEAEKAMFAEGGFPVAPIYYYTNMYCNKTMKNIGYTPQEYRDRLIG